MDNYISIALIAISGICLFFGFVLGLKKGFGGSLVRFIVVVACAVVVYMFMGKVMEFALANINIQGMNLIDFVMSKIPSDYQDLAEDIEPLVYCLVQVILFIVAFLAVKLVSIIVSGLINAIFCRGKKAKFLGGLVGLVQGAFVAICICVPLTGVASNVAKVEEVEMNGSKLVTLPEKADCKEATTSGIGSYYLQYGEKLFTMVSTYENADGEKYTLSGQVDAFTGVVKLADKLSSLGSMDFSAGLTSANSEDIKNMFNEIGSVMGELSEEALETIEDLLADAAKSFELPIDVSKIDIKDVDWSKEGEIVADLLQFQDKEDFSEEDINTLVKDVAESKLILECLQAAEVSVDITADQKEEVLSALSDVDAETKEKIMELFNITE